MIGVLPSVAFALQAGSLLTSTELPQHRCDPSGRGDSTRVVEYLHDAGYRQVRISAVMGPYYAVVAEKTDSGFFVVTLRVCSPGVMRLDEPWPLAFSEPHLEWIHLQGDGATALVATFDDLAEAEVFTLVYLLVEERRLSRIYADREATCRPAEITDLDGDGQKEMVAYVEGPGGGNCGNRCHVALAQRFEGFTPNWVEVRQWDGTEWVSAEQRHRAFYARLAARYAAVQEWVDGGEGSEECKGVYWLSPRPRLFEEWARRARVLAGGG